MIMGCDLLNELGMVLNFQTKFIKWDKALVAMNEYDLSESTTTIATNMLLDTIDKDLEANVGIPMPNMPSHLSQEINYQEKDSDLDGYKQNTSNHLYVNNQTSIPSSTNAYTCPQNNNSNSAFYWHNFQH